MGGRADSKKAKEVVKPNFAKKAIGKGIKEVVRKEDIDDKNTKYRGKGKGNGNNSKGIGKSDGSSSQLWRLLDDYNEDSDSSEISWHDSDEDDELIETDDSLGDDELGSGDEEYQEAREKITQEELRIPEFEQIETGDVVGEGSGYVAGESGDEMVSDYLSSDAELNSDSSDDGDDFLPRRRVGRKLYDPKCDPANLKLTVGLRFEDAFQCKEALKSWAVVKGYPIHFRMVSKTQLEAYCTAPCPWRCYGSIIRKEQNFGIKVINEPHDCKFDIHNKQADYKWIGRQYVNVFRVRPSMTVRELDVDLKHKYLIEVSRARLHRAKHHAFELLRGTVKQHCNSLRSYISELMRVDKEGRFELEVGEDSLFQRLYIGFSALKRGFMQGCRWIIGLDGCFLKTYLRGQLLCATTKDGNNQMYPIAWAVVEVENEATWTWFINILLEELGMNDGLGLTFISDQQKVCTYTLQIVFCSDLFLMI